MKVETLIKRYQKKGYIPLENIPDELQVMNIKLWLYKEKGIYISTIFNKSNYPKLKLKKGFWGKYSYNDINDFTTEKTFKNPYDAIYKVLCMITHSLNFKYNF